MNTKSEFIREVWSQPSTQQEIDFSQSPDEIADEIIKILTHRLFNYRSKKSISQIIFKVRQNLLRQINNGTTIHFYLLYNGGYRASPLPNQLSLIFEPDQTELMLLYQITLLKKEIFNVCKFGIKFFIVINNGVAKWVNDISITATENYTNQLRKIIKFYGAENNVRVLLQSELVGFDPSFSFEPSQQQSLLSEDEHLIVERFLGRYCSREEAEHRSALYELAESKWAEDLSIITTAKVGIVMRQVAHPEMLSFRPFPGGAIRIQNGTFGFQYQKNSLRPKLITAKGIKENDVKWVHCYFPLGINNNNLNTNDRCNAEESDLERINFLTP
jgi:hypothetical protein